MDYYIIIPAHNEEAFLADTLTSVLRQSLLPKKIIVVNDNSDDATGKIIEEFMQLCPIIQQVKHTSSEDHMPGSKVIKAFNKGLEHLDSDYDFLVKLDADCILPDTYFERLAYVFKGNPKVGIAGGFAYEKDNHDQWKLNHPMNDDHVRGAFKAYSKSCFKAIGGLRQAMGWDTLDELLAQYHDYEIHTDHRLQVKHLRPTGTAYNQKAKLLQGKAMYAMGYGFGITFVASVKMAFKQRKLNAFFDNMEGFLTARRNNEPLLVNEEESKFIQKLRWKNMLKKLS
ncbi:glycosyltransferase family 2 protein [Aggregatimonas sangjinii]|uniref:Glycosyltransferase family 2 protein n=1 Tax=Aggregatimonas sangjinii TaxID=2583587 RepID=A0A5B7SVF2_9FLAO|nr:glycosyltransferase family 2 protein [Aggregatimonas sangjinii]QCX01123.1 glycosyltransferase family 2 protein [Aggregatimonas sangjinii]